MIEVVEVVEVVMIWPAPFLFLGDSDMGLERG